MHIGILHYKETPQFMGRHIVNDQFIEALYKYKGEHQITLICPEAITEEHLSDFLREHPLDVLHYPGPDMYRAMDLKRLNPKPMVVTGITHTLGHQPFMEWLHMTRLANPKPSDALICTSPQAELAISKMQDSIGEVSRLPTVQCSLGVDASKFYKAKIKKDYLNLLYLGRLCPYTKVDLLPLLEMVKNVSAQVSKSIRLTIAGSDGSNYSEILLKRAKELELQLVVENNVSDERKMELYCFSDIFLAPSNNTQETFGLTILEASAAGLPIVAYDWSGYRHLIEEGKNGFLIPTTLKPKGSISPYQYDAINQYQFSSCVEVDRSLFEQKLTQLIVDDELRERMSIDAMAIASEFDWSKIIPEVLFLWERLLGRAVTSISALETLDYFKVFSDYATPKPLPENLKNYLNNPEANFIKEGK